MISKQLRKEILKELIMGAAVQYIGPNYALRSLGPLTKLSDRSRFMRVAYSGFEYKLKYHNLTCDKIEVARSIAQRLTEDPNELPF